MSHRMSGSAFEGAGELPEMIVVVPGEAGHPVGEGEPPPLWVYPHALPLRSR